MKEKISESIVNKKFISTIFLLFLISCSSDSGDPSGITLKQKGGVDGSGGNLTKVSYKEFREVVTNQLPFLTQTLINRTQNYLSYRGTDKLLVKELNNKPDIIDGEYTSIYSTIPEYITQLFTSTNKFKLLIKKISYHPKKGQCISDNHKDEMTDAAINSAGVICLSYDSFKGYEGTNLLRKLLVITMHEVTHYAGGDENEASEVQNFYDTHKVGKNLILIGNQRFANYERYIDNTLKIIEQLIFKISTTTHYNEYCDIAENLGNLHKYLDKENSFSSTLPLELQEDFSSAPYMFGICSRPQNIWDDVSKDDVYSTFEELVKLSRDYNKKLKNINKLIHPYTYSDDFTNRLFIKKVPEISFDKKNFDILHESYYWPPHPIWETGELYCRFSQDDMELSAKNLPLDRKNNIFESKKEVFHYEKGNKPNRENSIEVRYLDHQIYHDVTMELPKNTLFSYTGDHVYFRPQNDRQIKFRLHSELNNKKSFKFHIYENTSYLTDNSHTPNPLKNTIKQAPKISTTIEVNCSYE